MGIFSKRIAQIGILKFTNIAGVYGEAARLIEFAGGPLSGYSSKSFAAQPGVGFLSGRGKLFHQEIIAPGNSSLTTGVAAIGQTQILALTGLTTAPQTILAASLAAQPDVPRAVRIVAARSGATAVGNGGFTGTNSCYVTIIGTNFAGETVTEWVPLNDTTAVNGKKAFVSITSVILPAAINATGDQVSIGYSGTFGIRRPIQATTDVFEFSRKATAATVYTSEALPTLNVGEAYSTLSAAISATATSFSVASASAFPSGSQLTIADLIQENGSTEQIYITNITSNTMTVVRGVNGTKALSFLLGARIAMRSPHTLTTTVTANDRLQIFYTSGIL